MSALLPSLLHSPRQDAEAKSARALDKFYTRPEIAQDCVNFFEAETGLDLATEDSGAIIEPSAGNGAFLDTLPKRTIGYDLCPEDDRIIRQDFLQLSRIDPAIVIGNPPFGKAARLAIKFFNKAAEFATHIGFIVPRSFEKTSIQSRLDLQFHLDAKMRLPEQSFFLGGATYDVPCIFQIWQRRDVPRTRQCLPRTHVDFEFVSREEADFAFQRVGVKAGTIKTDFDTVAATSHHFLRARIDVNRFAERLHAIDFDDVKFRTAGNPSISKTELVALYTAQEKFTSSRAENQELRVLNC